MTLPPSVVHLATHEAFALFQDHQTGQTFLVSVLHLDPASIRAAWHEARAEYYEENPDQIPRDTPGVLCFVALAAGFAVICLAVAAFLYFTR